LSAAAGNLSTAAVTSGLLLVTDVISRSSTAGGTNNAQVNTQASASITNAAALLTSLASNTNTVALTATEIQQVQQASANLLNSARQVASASSSTADTINVVSSMNSITSSNKLLGVPATPAQSEAVTAASVEISSNVARSVTQSFVPAGVAPADIPAAIQTVLRQRPDLFESVVSSSLLIPPTTVKSQAVQNSNALVSAGANPLPALVSRLTQAFQVSTDIRTVAIGGVTASDAITRLFGASPAALTFTLQDASGRVATVSQVEAGSVSVSVDNVTSQVIISLPGETYSGTIAGVRAAPSVLPTGVRFNADGSALIVNGGFAIEISPAPIDLAKFITTVERAGFPFRINANASISLEVGNGERFSGVFAYDNLTGINLAACGALSFIEPTGALNSPSYAFSVRCANGATQRVVPFIESATFVSSVRAFGLTPSTDRNTGFVTIPTVGVFKPNFFVLPLTAADQAFHAANKDAFGNAVQYLDVNRDGKLDVRLITATGTQWLYGR
jgi:hypothetical protein